MAEGGKFVMRPKVRFCQKEDDDEDQEYEKNHKISISSKKPLIKNIISIEKPYRIISVDENLTSNNIHEEKKLDNFQNVFGHQKRQLHDFDEEEVFAGSLRKFVPSSSNDERSNFPIEYENLSVDSSLSSKEDMVENSKIIQVEVHAENSSEIEPKISFQEEIGNNIIENSYEKEKNLFNKTENDIQEKFEETEAFIKSQEKKNLSSIQEESLEFEIPPKGNSIEMEPIKIPEELKLITKKTTEPKSPKKTFKCLNSSKRQLNSINRLSKSVKSPKKIQDNVKNIKLLNSKNRPKSLGYLQRNSKIKVSGVMPCLKAKIAEKVKISPIKKTVLRNIVVKPTKYSVEPGISRSHKELKIDFEDKPRENIQLLNPEKLSRPEYNSIMCTIKKLKEVQKENIVSDVEHLPPKYKSLINGKVTNSLDFPPDESIFKNLINLSIDESQFPTRMTRSKDPEPRQRDAVPKLSDFFIPKYANEYCTAVCVKPKSPEPIENWNAFRISDKIRSWKWNMDFVH